AREKAKAAACLSNTKQIAIAVAMYTNDYDGRYPFSWAYDWSYRWFEEQCLQAYVKNWQVLVCPATKPWTSWGVLYNRTTYSYNCYFGWHYDPAVNHPAYQGVSESDVPRPAEKILILDATPIKVFYTNYYSSADYGSYYSFQFSEWNWYSAYLPTYVQSESEYRKAFLHNGGINAVFADAHAKWKSGRDLMGDANAHAHFWPLD
ncbi:MAG: DUF1559 domain-containing protein, partial [Armatimonadota bacterium]